MQLYNLLTRIGPTNVFTPDFLARVDTREPPSAASLATYAALLPAATLNRTLAVRVEIMCWPTTTCRRSWEPRL
jgi:hypothetical protein